MCHISCVEFGAINLKKADIEGKTVLEIGSNNINGGIGNYVKSLSPKKYVGIDIVKGSGVDIVCNVEDIVEKFGENSFDVVISTEVIEHVRDWRKAVGNIKKVCKAGGTVLITTRSHGFHYHGYPYDFWRYEIDDIKNIFSDCEILVLEKDREAPGVFSKMRKSVNFSENDLSDYELYSVVSKKRVKSIKDSQLKSFGFIFSTLKSRLADWIFNFGKKNL